MTKEEVRAAIIAGQPLIAINNLRKLDLSTEDEQSLSLIEAELNNFQRKEINGLLSAEQQQLARNQINEKLLKLLEAPPTLNTRGRSYKFLPFVALGIALLLCYLVILPHFESTAECPSFSEGVNNKVLLIPFTSLGSESAQPHLLLRDRIEALTIKRNLSTEIGLKSNDQAVSIGQAEQLAKDCGANVVVWGKYLQQTDSISLILQYSFLEQPNWSELGKLIKLKDITAIQRGEISKPLEDAILALCGIIAIHEGQAEVAAKWLEKVQEKDAVDLEILAQLRE